jgi:two-component system chemotaxis response regulator CheB
VLVVDDSLLFRKVVRDALAHEPGVEVVGSAADGRAALAKISQFQPDAVTLDLEMPAVDGLEVLRQLRYRAAPPGVIVVSALTDAGAALTTQALRLGAFDFVLKPSGPNFNENRDRLASDLLPKIRLLASQRKLAPVAGQAAGACGTLPPLVPAAATPWTRPEIVAIGVSTGGPSALHVLLPKLPADFPLPIVVVQHMPPKFTRSLADDLDRHCSLHVTEAATGDCLRPGTVYFAPGGFQTRIVRHPHGLELCVTDDPPEKSCKPSVDYLFRSLAEQFGPRVLAVIMTGMGDDGAVGSRLLKRRGSHVIAQDQASCVVYGMPRQVIEQGIADVVSPLESLHDAILHAVSGGVVPC